jgi:hypothetical protein
MRAATTNRRSVNNSSTKRDSVDVSWACGYMSHANGRGVTTKRGDHVETVTSASRPQTERSTGMMGGERDDNTHIFNIFKGHGHQRSPSLSPLGRGEVAGEGVERAGRHDEMRFNE